MDYLDQLDVKTQDPRVLLNMVYTVTRLLSLGCFLDVIYTDLILLVKYPYNLETGRQSTESYYIKELNT